MVIIFTTRKENTKASKNGEKHKKSIFKAPEAI
jgi:hypothetical protein